MKTLSSFVLTPFYPVREMMSKKGRKHFTLQLVIFMLLVSLQSCGNDGLLSTQNALQFLPNLSDYAIFQGSMSNLEPSKDFVGYELSSQLFSDYAEKQRLIRLPNGTRMTYSDDGLPGFPENTIIVKTFYYFNDKRNSAKGKNIIETRLLIKKGETWNAATYLWNEAQTDALLITSGFDKHVQWIDDSGAGKVISYHVPNNRECATCHQSGGQTLPIGPKIRNLNKTVSRNGTFVNQLQYFSNKGLLTTIEPFRVRSLPDEKNTVHSLQERARAYLDVNCAHCHRPGGYCANQALSLEYTTPFEQTDIRGNKVRILSFMRSGFMPLLGKSVSDEEGIALLTNYINSLP